MRFLYFHLIVFSRLLFNLGFQFWIQVAIKQLEELLPQFLLKDCIEIYLQLASQFFNILLRNHPTLYLFCFLLSFNNTFRISFLFYLFLLFVSILPNIPVLQSSLLSLKTLKRKNWVIIDHGIVICMLQLCLSSLNLNLQILKFCHCLIHFTQAQCLISIFYNLIFLLPQLALRFEIFLFLYF